jgi:uncharacterized membrane protein YgcG
MKKLGWLIGLVLLLLPGAARAQAEWSITQFDSRLEIQTDGRVAVTETITVNFSIPKHGIFRDLPYGYQDPAGQQTYTEIDLQGITLDGRAEPVEQIRGDANLRFKIGRPNRTITGRHVYVIAYFATGVLRAFPSHDELYWNSTGNGWEVPIEAATATVRLPRAGLVQAACYEGGLGSTRACGSVQKTDNQATFAAKNSLHSGGGLTVAVGYTSGLVPILRPARPLSLGQRMLQTHNLAVGLAVLMLGELSLGLLWRAKGRDPKINRTIVAEYEPPAGLRPAEVGVLMDDRADTKDVTATIVDLAARGFLTISEVPKKWLFGSIDYILKQQPGTGELLPFERKLYDQLFESGNEVKVSALKNKFYQELSAVKKLLYEQVAARGLYAGNPETARHRFAGGAILVLLVSGFFFYFSLKSASPVAVDLTIAVGLLGLSLLGYSQSMSRRTALGREQLIKARGYELFINTAEKYREQFKEKEGLFNQLIPYAIIFGATKRLAKAMKDMAIQMPSPVWYYGYAGGFDLENFSRSIDSFSNSLSGAIASTPGGTGSGGGGFSGGGFGGGGGGSW